MFVKYIIHCIPQKTLQYSFCTFPYFDMAMLALKASKLTGKKTIDTS